MGQNIEGQAPKQPYEIFKEMSDKEIEEFIYKFMVLRYGHEKGVNAIRFITDYVRSTDDYILGVIKASRLTVMKAIGDPEITKNLLTIERLTHGRENNRTR